MLSVTVHSPETGSSDPRPMVWLRPKTYSVSVSESSIMCGLSAPMEPFFSPELNDTVLNVTTEGGNTVQVTRDRMGFPAAEGIAGWGLLIDMAHVEKVEYNGWPLSWRPNIQENDSHYRKDELFGSFALTLQHQSCHGLIRGAESPYIDRNESNVA